MKKIINGKVYDTAKAENLAGWSNGFSTSDFGYCEETLYRKRTGEMFLHGEGGPASKYSESHGNNEWGFGEKIVPLSYDAARKWAEDHLDADRYEAIFGEVADDDDSRVNITVYLPSSTAERAKREAAKRGISLSAYIESLI